MQRKQESLYRSVVVRHSQQQPHQSFRGTRCIAFNSNDYLGLANHPILAKAAKDALARYGVGSGSAHLINGHTAQHHALEEYIAEFFQRERALLFSCGYMANVGVLSALIEEKDILMQDKLNHASLIDGGRLARTKSHRYRHSDVEHLRQLFQKHSGKHRYIATDGLFSMDGDIAPLTQLSDLSNQVDASLIVDDAHGIGVLGATGRGSIEHHQLPQSAVPVLIGTFGKALGAYGAFVTGSADLIDFLTQYARTYIFTTAGPPAMASAAMAALQYIAKNDERREKLFSLIEFMHQQLRLIGLPVPQDKTPIIPIVIGSAEKTLHVAQQLIAQGLLVTAIRPPTVKQGESRLRITLSANHEEQDILMLCERLAPLLLQESII